MVYPLLMFDEPETDDSNKESEAGVLIMKWILTFMTAAGAQSI